MITVHHLENSRSQRVLWLLEELGLQYTVQRYARDPQTLLAPATLRQVHPLGKSPVLQIGDEVLAESGHILETLAERYGEGRMLAPVGTPERDQTRYWLHYAEGSLMPPLLLKLVFDRLARAPMPFFAKPIARAIAAKAMAGFVAPQIALHLGYLEGALAQSPWFIGECFTVADVQLSFPLEAAAQRAGLDERYPRLRDFLARIHARPAYQRALQQGGPYTLLG